MKNFIFNLSKTIVGACFAAFVILCVSVSVPNAMAQANYFGGPTAVTQATSATTGVTANSGNVVITTVSLTNAAGVSTSFTLTDGSIKADSNIQVSVVGYTGTITTNGIPYAQVDTRADGSCVVRVTNLGAANALSGAVSVAVLVAN